MPTHDEIIAKLDEERERLLDQGREALLAGLDVARAGTRRYLDTLTDEQLATPVPGAPWMDGTIGGVLLTNAYHQIQHWTWVEEGLSKTPMATE